MNTETQTNTNFFEKHTYTTICVYLLVYKSYYNILKFEIDIYYTFIKRLTDRQTEREKKRKKEERKLQCRVYNTKYIFNAHI